MASVSPRSRRIKLVLIDDDTSMLRLLEALIRRSIGPEIEILPYDDPTVAHDFLERELVDIVVTDLEMPNLNGLEILRMVKTRNPCAQVLLITGHSAVDSLLAALEHGATDYLVKPIDHGVFIELIQDALKRGCRWRKALAKTLNASTA